MDPLVTLHADRQVIINFADESRRQCTVKDLWNFFDDEDPDWKLDFFDRLLLLGESTTAFATYVLQ